MSCDYYKGSVWLFQRWMRAAQAEKEGRDHAVSSSWLPKYLTIGYWRKA